MSTSDALYRELRDDLQAVVGPLFDFACTQVQTRGEFLPFGARLTADGEVAIVMAAPEEDETNSEEVLPLLIEALHDSAGGANAVASCEWIQAEFQPGIMQDAVKVRLQHRRGLSVAYYLPSSEHPQHGWEFGEMIATPAEDLFTPYPSA